MLSLVEGCRQSIEKSILYTQMTYTTFFSFLILSYYFSLFLLLLDVIQISKAIFPRDFNARRSILAMFKCIDFYSFTVTFGCLLSTSMESNCCTIKKNAKSTRQKNLFIISTTATTISSIVYIQTQWNRN